MLATLARVVRELASAIRLADVIDVIVVSTFVYATITWVRGARSRFVLRGFATLVALYFVARLLDMYLTLVLFQAGITVALLALVVIFQEEIRRAFERIATTGLLRGERPSAAASLEMLGPLVEATWSLAQTRTGALIVLRGREPLERHTTGGILLEGRFSQPLLFSIFDASSAGHDGAVILEDGRIGKFAVHLPLSTRVEEGARLGTRHTAALGLSERSDALVVVVSEERGTVSVARGGTLSEQSSAAELHRRLSDFLAEVAPRERKKPWRRLLAKNMGTKALSVALAVLAWLVVFGQQSETVARTYKVPIVYRDVPDGWILDDLEPLESQITISGKSRAFELLNPATLRLSLDGTSLKPGRQTIKLAPSQLDLPSGFTVHEIEPQSASFTAQPTSASEVAVKADLIGRLPDGLTLKRVTVEPARLRLLVVHRDRARFSSLRSEPIELSEVSGTTSLTRGVIIPKGSRLARGEPTEVRLLLDIEGSVK
jgi:diadenylate cyclase